MLVFVKLFLFYKGNILKQYSTTLWGSEEFLNEIVIYSMITFTLFYIIFMQFKRNKINKKAFSVFLCCLIILEGVFNSSVYIGNGARQVNGFKNVMNLENKIKDDDFYRVKVRNKYFDRNNFVQHTLYEVIRIRENGGRDFKTPAEKALEANKK